MKKKKIGILVYSNIAKDIRVLRQVYAAKDKYDIYVIAFGDWDPPANVNYIQINKSKRTFLFLLLISIFIVGGRLFKTFYDKAFWLNRDFKNILKIIVSLDLDLLHANDWYALPIAGVWAEKTNRNVIYDAHEFTPYQLDNNPFSNFFLLPYRSFLIKKYSLLVAKFINASTEFSLLYKEYFGLESTTIYNAPNYIKVNIKKVNPEEIRIIHHGYAIPNRMQDELIRTMPMTNCNYHLFFMLLEGNNPKYLQYLKEYAQKTAPHKITFLDAVDPHDVVQVVCKFDIGIPYLISKHKNQFYAQQNKFFDYIMAGLCIVSSPSQGLQGIVNKYKLGVFSDKNTSESLAAALNSLSEDDINNHKRSAIKAARIFNSEIEMGKLIEIYDSQL